MNSVTKCFGVALILLLSLAPVVAEASSGAEEPPPQPGKPGTVILQLGAGGGTSVAMAFTSFLLMLESGFMVTDVDSTDEAMFNTGLVLGASIPLVVPLTTNAVGNSTGYPDQYLGAHLGGLGGAVAGLGTGLGLGFVTGAPEVPMIAFYLIGTTAGSVLGYHAQADGQEGREQSVLPTGTPVVAPAFDRSGDDWGATVGWRGRF